MSLLCTPPTIQPSTAPTSGPDIAPAQLVVDVAGADDLMRPKDVAARLGIGIGLLRALRIAGTGPKVIILSPKVVRYRRSAVEAFLAARTSGGVQ